MCCVVCGTGLPCSISSGALCSQEIKALIQAEGWDQLLDQRYIDGVVSAYDLDGDDLISLDEFRKMYEVLKRKAQHMQQQQQQQQQQR